MNQFNKAQVIMLPTENEGKGIYLNPVPSINKIHYWDMRISNSYISQHLYIISNDEIKEGDYCIDTSINRLNQVRQLFDYSNKACKKIIATTDTSLNKDIYKNIDGFDRFIEYGLPQPSQQFITNYIESYNKCEVITDILVEVEWIFNGENPLIDNHQGSTVRLKVNPNNTITIKQHKDNYNRDEVIELIKQFNLEMSPEVTNYHRDKWIKENL